MEGSIKRLRIFPEKGSSGLELAEGRLIENIGLEGDYHAKGGERQISLLFAETEQNGQGLCFNKFKENINISFVKPVAVKAGTRLETGETVLEITGEIKHCYKECHLYVSGKLCSLIGPCLFAKVLKSGTIRVGDRVYIIT